MIGSSPVVSFDTSTHNRLVDDGPRSEPIIAALRAGFFVRFAGLSIEEIIATPDASKRAALFASCRRLQAGPHDCIYPHNELLRRLIVEHAKKPGDFDWRAVDVRAHEYEREVNRGEVITDDGLSAEQLQSAREVEKAYEKMFSDLRPKLEKVFAAHGQAPPPTFKAVLPLVQATGGLAWSIGKLLYDRASDTDASEATIREFMSVCPPSRAIVYAILLSWYDRSLRDRHTGERFRCRRSDLFMAACLPYCDQFVTAEVNGEQERCLREVASAANLNVEVRSYDDFCASFLVTA